MLPWHLEVIEGSLKCKWGRDQLFVVTPSWECVPLLAVAVTCRQGPGLYMVCTTASSRGNDWGGAMSTVIALCDLTGRSTLPPDRRSALTGRGWRGSWSRWMRVGNHHLPGHIGAVNRTLKRPVRITTDMWSVLTNRCLFQMSRRSSKSARWTALTPSTFICSPLQREFHLPCTVLPFQTAPQPLREASVNTTVLRDTMFRGGALVEKWLMLPQAKSLGQWFCWGHLCTPVLRVNSLCRLGEAIVMIEFKQPHKDCNLSRV